MKFLILGSSGMAGHTIAMYLTEQGHDVIGFDRTKTGSCKVIIGDARDTATLRQIIIDGKYDSIINCIGILNQFAEKNKELATFLNSYIPHFLAHTTSDTNTQVIHMSTDCVFSGKRGKYTEHDFPDGETFYDRSKALGELVDEKNITLRNSIIGADINPEGIGLFNWFMKQNGTIRGFTKAMWTGLSTLQLAKAMEAAAKEKANGLYNMVYSEPISKYDLLKLFNRYIRNEKLEILPSDNLIVDKSLKRTNFNFGYLIPDYEVMISQMTDWILKHKNMYPHYNL